MSTISGKASVINRPHDMLKLFWGYDRFRAGQEEAVQSVLDGRDTLVLFPTGGGKSLCFQVPALCLDGLTLVVSPLIALMQDQVDQLAKRKIPATFINSSLSTYEVEQRLINARNGMYKLMYCSPERLQTNLFQHEMLNLNIALVAIDEAHCISEWGHEFRPPYRLIRDALRPLDKKTRWMALTATATPEVKDDILKSLQFKKPVVIKGSFDRPNLNWWVHRTADKLGHTLRIAKMASGSGLVYAFTRSGCEKIAQKLREQGINAAAYHGGMESEKRKDIQNRWISGEIPVVVCTNAFGMGVDKPDCRWVVHHDVSPSLEGYYQEAGRAGRDGNAAFPVLLIHETDIKTLHDKVISAYPDVKTMQRVYDGICDQWQLALGSEQRYPQPVNLEMLSKHSGLPRGAVQQSIKLLEKAGIVSTDEEVSHLTSVRFQFYFRNLDQVLESFNNERKSAFVETLFRNFGREACDRFVAMDTHDVLRFMDMSANSLLKGLLVLKNDGLIDFHQSDHSLRVALTDPRYEKLEIEKGLLYNYRDVLLRKVGFVDDFAHSRSCRNRFLRFYFGDENIPKQCGHCDVCAEKHPADFF
jgi:ATP-dependent DNA helicase RecQ